MSKGIRGSEQVHAAAASVPSCVNWSVEEVADWVQSLGFPQYRVRHLSLCIYIVQRSRDYHGHTLTVESCTLYILWTSIVSRVRILHIYYPLFFQECFIVNVVSGRKLVWVTASTLSSMGIADWKHIQVHNIHEQSTHTLASFQPTEDLGTRLCSHPQP